MATTIGDIIRSAMRKVGILAAGEPIPAEDERDSIAVFRQMVDAWTNETLLIPIVSEVIFQMLESTGEYTIGIYAGTPPAPANHFETARPERILSGFIRDGSGTDYNLELIDTETFSRISRKSTVSRPSRVYVRKGWPLNTLLFESLPYAEDNLHLTVVQPLAEMLPVAELTEVVNLPPGYEQNIIFNLALMLAPEWGKTPSNFVVVTAVEGKKWLKRNNYRSIVLGMDNAVATWRRGAGTYIIDSGP